MLRAAKVRTCVLKESEGGGDVGGPLVRSLQSQRTRGPAEVTLGTGRECVTRDGQQLERLT